MAFLITVAVGLISFSLIKVLRVGQAVRVKNKR